MIFLYALVEKIILKQIMKQIGFSTSTNSGNHLNLSIPHNGYQLFQVTFSFYFHFHTSDQSLHKGYHISQTFPFILQNVGKGTY